MKPNDILLSQCGEEILIVLSIHPSEILWESERCKGFSLIENIEDFFEVIGNLD
jgi:hypothetical protein